MKAAVCVLWAALTIVRAPQLESARATSAIVTWTTNTKGGSVVHYGTRASDLGRTATSPNRYNRNLPYMVHRVLLWGLTPGTTYYYAVESDGARSAVGRFSTMPK